MVLPRVGFVGVAVAVALLAGACSSGGGAGTGPSSVPRATQLPASPGESTSSVAGGPTSASVTTEAPPTRPSTSEAPPTRPAGTEAPAEATTTEAPARGESIAATTTAQATTTPSTRPSSSTEPNTTEAGTTEASTTEPPATSQPSTTTVPTDEGGGTSWWPWGLLAIAAVAVVAGILLAMRSRKPLPWSARTASALGESDQITTSLVGLTPNGLAAVAGADAARLAALMASVEELMVSAPDDGASRALASLQGPLRSLHGVVDAVAFAATPPSVADVEQVRARATELHSATSLARAMLVPPPAPPPAPPG